MAADNAGQTPIDPDAILRHPFPTVRKGYDPLEVQKYLMALAGELRVGRDRVRDLERKLAEATHRADDLEHMSPQRLTALLGEETAKVIEAANRAAADIRTKAEENVARLLRDAQDKAAKMHREAETVLDRKTQEAEEAAAAVRAQADQLLVQARADAATEVEGGEQRGREMVTEAQRVRERILRELARRRKTLRQQIEQLQAGRERLIESFAVIRETIEVATDELDVALPEAKVAADAALQRATEEDEDAIEADIAALTSEVDAALDGKASPLPDEDHMPSFAKTEREPADDVRSNAGQASALAEEGSEDLASGETVLVEPEVAERGLDEEAEQGRRAPDPVAGRHSSAVTVIAKSGGGGTDTDGDMAGSSARVTSLFARIKQEATADEVHGEAAARLIPTEAAPSEPDELSSDLTTLPLDERCARVLTELERTLARHVKRELSDEQNELLDAVRRDTTSPAARDVLPDPEDHVERYASAAYASVSDAAVAGGQLLGPDARTAGAVPRVGGMARDVAAELAAEIVAPLRDRLEGNFADATDDEDQGTLTEAIRACYREWRTRRVDPAVGQAVLTAFNRGVLIAARTGVGLRWHLEAGTPGCEECASNAAAGGTAAGEPFPSGHDSPPVHDGCRCVLVAADE